MSDEHEGQQRPGVPRGGPARRGTYASARGEDEQKAARVFYVAATWATQRVVSGDAGRKD